VDALFSDRIMPVVDLAGGQDSAPAASSSSVNPPISAEALLEQARMALER
jgi:hypothetical protein